MSYVNYRITDKTLTMYIGGQPFVIDRDSAVFSQVRDELNSPNPDSDKLRKLADTVRTVQRDIERVQNNTKFANYLPKGAIKVTREGVTFDGEFVESALADRLMDIAAAGLRLGSWVRFAENVYMNPAEYAREELYEWLAKSDLPITEDGCFLAYKVVRDDYTDVYTGTFDNSVGQLVELPNRESVDPNRLNLCSTGLHFCSKEYLPHFGFNNSGRKVMVVKINPADVVSIPADYDNTKGRTWRYEVVDEITDVPGITDRTWSPVVSDYDYDSYDYDLDDDDYDPELDDLDSSYDEELEEDLEVENEYDDAVATLMDYGIVELRRMASKEGLNSVLAWKVYNKEQLAGYIAERQVG